MNNAFDFATSPVVPGLSVIEASAGTGKTYAISHLVARLLLDGTAGSLAEIVLVTYTNDATGELASRVRRVLTVLAAPASADEAAANPGVHTLRTLFGDEAARRTATRALIDLDLLNVSTLHSFCQRILQTEGTLCGLPVIPELITDSTEIAAEAVAKTWETRIAGDPVLAFLATQGKWSASGQAGFVTSALAIPDVEFLPAPRPISEIVAALQAIAGRFTPDVCESLQELWNANTEWNGTAPTEEQREALLTLLKNARDILAPGFFAAVADVAGSPTWITSRKKAGKELRARVEASDAVRMARAFGELIKSAEWHFQTGLFRDVQIEIEATLAANRQITYDGLISAVYNALRGPQADELARTLRRRFKVALIDESQDTDARQFGIFRRIFVEGDAATDGHRLVLIGDPKQAIYAFRGADVNTYLDARDEAGANVFTLGTTFRSPQALVRATNALFSRPQSLLKEGLDFRDATSGLADDLCLSVGGVPDAARLEVWLAPDSDSDAYSTVPKRTARIAADVASEIVRLLSHGAMIERVPANKTGADRRPVQPGDFAVLVSEGLQARAIAEALAARSVPAIRAGADDVMTSSEAADLSTLLRAMQDPRRGSLRRAALATTLLGRTAADIVASGAADEIFLDRLIAWQSVWEREGIAAALAAIDRDEHVMERLASLERGERRVTNLRQLTDLLEAASHELGRDRTRLTRWLSAEIAAAGARSDVEERQQQLESDADAVQIVTMHASKGLEYSLVFCPFLWSGKSRPAAIQKLARRGEPTRLVHTGLEPSATQEIARAQLEDRLRLAYVAVTRARVKVWIHAGEVCGRMPASALDWLLREDAGTDVAVWMPSACGEGRGLRHQRGFESLVAAAGAGDVTLVRPPPPASFERWEGHQVSGSESLAVLMPPRIPTPWGMTSFSALTREKNPHGNHDEVPRADGNEASEVKPNPFFDAPGGTLVGTVVHEFIERWDFSEPDLSVVAAHCRRYPLPDVVPSFARQFAGMLDELRLATLPSSDVCVAKACAEPRASEWHFQLPIRSGLDAGRLAEVFERHGMSAYAARLAELPAEDIFGYLHGFIDRLTFHEGTWGVVDWKTNRLGDTPAAYDGPSLLECAMRSHYLLQAHLYLVALRRFTPAPLAGAWLAFVRAVKGGTSRGFLHIAPPPALLDDLDELFARPR